MFLRSGNHFWGHCSQNKFHKPFPSVAVASDSACNDTKPCKNTLVLSINLVMLTLWLPDILQARSANGTINRQACANKPLDASSRLGKYLRGQTWVESKQCLVFIWARHSQINVCFLGLRHTASLQYQYSLNNQTDDGTLEILLRHFDSYTQPRSFCAVALPLFSPLSSHSHGCKTTSNPPLRKSTV